MSRPVGEDDDIASDQVARRAFPIEGEVGLTGEHKVELGNGSIVDPKAPGGCEIRAAEDDAADVDLT
jgi:hypothetical protein